MRKRRNQGQARAAAAQSPGRLRHCFAHRTNAALSLFDLPRVSTNRVVRFARAPANWCGTEVPGGSLCRNAAILRRSFPKGASAASFPGANTRQGGCEVASPLLETRKIKDAYPSYAPQMGLVPWAVHGRGLDRGRDDVSEPASISLGIAGRYAQAMFEIAKEENALKSLEADADALGAVLTESPELAAMIASPVVARDDQARAMAAVASAMQLSSTSANTLALMASKRRLFVLPQLVADLKARIAVEKGEVTAEVTSATTLTADQAAKLAETLKARVGKHVKLNTSVDESLIGGLIVKLGSVMIDTSVKAKLAALQNAMKEVG